MAHTGSRAKVWLERIGLIALVIGAYVVWGLWNDLDFYALIGIPIGFGALVGFLLLVLSLSEKVSGAVVALVYVLALTALGALLWLATGHAGVVAFTVVPVGVLGMICLIAGLVGWREEALASRTPKDRKTPQP
jgi:hypothetical protein